MQHYVSKNTKARGLITKPNAIIEREVLLMDTEQIIRLIEAVSDSGLGEFEYQQDDVRLVLKAKVPVSVAMPAPEMVMPMTNIAPQAISPAAADNKEVAINEGEVVKSPLVGTFYSAPAEGEAPFVSVGDHVKKGQIIGIIETMKLMNEVESDRDGVVTAILIENEQVVEFGQPLVAIK